MVGYFINLEEKVGGEILKSPPVRYDIFRISEYINKIQFYLPQMLPLLEGQEEYESYPRRTLYAFNSPCGMCDYAGMCLNGDVMGVSIKEKKEFYGSVYLSPTQIIRYETCPRQWAYYVSGYRTELSPAKLHFGSSVHNAIEAHIIMDSDPQEAFSYFWGEYKDAPLQYTKKGANHEYYQKIGQSLMERFPEFWKKEKAEMNISEVQAEVANTKRLFNYNEYPVHLTCKPDIVCKSEDTTIIIDWKVTTKKTHDESWLSVSDQMTGYFVFLSQ